MSYLPVVSEDLFLGLSAALYLLGILAAIDALLSNRSSQAAIAWGLSLMFLPHLMLPIYLVFGRPRLVGYSKLSRKMQHSQKKRRHNSASPPENRLSLLGSYESTARTLEKIAQARFTAGNQWKLFDHGKAFFDSLLEDIRSAQTQVDLNFYVVRADKIGQRLKKELMDAAARGVKVRFLYDRLGSYPFSKIYIKELRSVGVELASFNTEQDWRYFLHLNFRNHRKIALIDHTVAYVGGFNVGDEYLGLSKEIGPWQDAQVRVSGPAVSEIEAIFLADWAWATQTEAQVAPVPDGSGAALALTVATGPADPEDRAILFFLELITSAKKRIWISSPYFVPDEAIMQALSLAVMRGVDVRILMPIKGDNQLVQWASLYYAYAAVPLGIKMYQYKIGFLHKKVVLVDDAFAVVGTVNLDNRSLRLNFEISIAFADQGVVSAVNEMFERDFDKSRIITQEFVANLSFFKKIPGRLARLISPIL